MRLDTLGERRAAIALCFSVPVEAEMVTGGEVAQVPGSRSWAFGPPFGGAVDCGAAAVPDARGTAAEAVFVARLAGTPGIIGAGRSSRTVTLSISERPRLPAPSYATASSRCSPTVAVRGSHSNFTAALLKRASGAPSRSKSIRAIPDWSKASTTMGTAPCASVGAISSTVGGVTSFATRMTRLEEIVRPSRSVAWA
jgi:hypothetical protein